MFYLSVLLFYMVIGGLISSAMVVHTGFSNHRLSLRIVGCTFWASFIFVFIDMAIRLFLEMTK